MLEATPSDGVHLITGTAGFIGFHLAERLLQDDRQVVGIDIVNNYYDPKLKEARLQLLENYKGFVNHRIALEDRDSVIALFDQVRPGAVINLAAQAGVRYSMENPQA
jgi:UDP-glucuronate 4-epimerase